MHATTGSRYVTCAELQCREDARISTAFVSALNALLTKHGLDISSRSAELQQALQPFFLRSWKATRDLKLRDSFVICLRIQLQLKGIQVSCAGPTLAQTDPAGDASCLRLILQFALAQEIPASFRPVQLEHCV